MRNTFPPPSADIHSAHPRRGWRIGARELTLTILAALYLPATVRAQSTETATATATATATVGSTSQDAQTRKHRDDKHGRHHTSTLAAVNVIGATSTSANPPSMIGSKEALTQRQIAQSVSVITQEQIQQQNMQTTDDALRYVPGVTVNAVGGGYTTYFSRGFQISTFQMDGVPTQVIQGAEIPGDLAMYDRVEVLRGPAGLLNGFGGDGGVINYVRKTAPSQLEASAQVQGGTYDNRSVQVDIGGPLNASRTIRGRVVAMQHDQDLNQHGTWQRDKQLYATLEADLTPHTLLRLGASYTDTSGKLMYNVPAYSTGKLMDIPVSEYLGASWNHTENKTFDSFVQLSHAFDNGWKGQLSFEHQLTHSSQIAGIAGGPVDPATDIGDLYSFDYSDSNTQNAVDIHATGPFTWFGRTHHLTIGANYLYEVDHYNRYFIDPSVGGDALGDQYINIYDNNAYFSQFDGPRELEHTTTQQYGLYANARFSLADPLTLITGGRVTWWRNHLTVPEDSYLNWWGMTNENDRIGPKFSPFVGLIYDINDTYSVYGSYTSIFVPQTGDYAFNGKIIAPITGEQFEVGSKAEYFDGRLNASIALFQITEKNRAYADPVHPGYDVAQGRARSRGFELQASGQVLPNLTVSGGYTFTQADNLDASANAVEAFSITTPKHLFKLWADYRLPASWSNWSFGLGTYVSSATYYTSSVENVVAHGYATVNAAVSYRINKHFSVSLNAANMFNRKYYQTVTANGNVYGDPAKVMMTLRAQL